MPHILHMGYGWVQLGMRSDTLLAFPLWIVLVLPFAKIVATSLSIGSGGSGGIFAPGMVVGGMLGATLWRLGYGVLPHMPPQPTAGYVAVRGAHRRVVTSGGKDAVGGATCSRRAGCLDHA
jgi:H+/Cl- antiporter ClcA